MRVLVLGRDLADLALLVAERIGDGGTVIAADGDPEVIARARRRAALECFDQVRFVTEPVHRLTLAHPVDAVVGRFVLMDVPDPIYTVRRLARSVRSGGRIAFQEWHFDSIRWVETSDWPRVTLYRQFVRLALNALRRRQAHVDMGLRLTNVFTEAGLSVPEICTDLRALNGGAAREYEFFESFLRDEMPAIEQHGLATAAEMDLDTFARRLKDETETMSGHVFLPLQVGACARC